MSVPEPGDPTPPVSPRPSRFSGLALVSFLLGVASTVLLALSGIPALWCGYHALYQINESEGQLKGRIFAIAGMIWGGLATVVTVGLFIFLVDLHLISRSDQAACANNLRQVGSALIQFGDKNQNAFPSATRPGAALSYDERLSWLTTILPYLDNRPDHPSPWQPLSTGFDPDRPWNTGRNGELTRPFLKYYACPAWPNMPTQVPAGLTSYVGLAGLGVDAPNLPAGAANAGFFGYDRVTTAAGLRGQGGEGDASNTSYILVTTETLRDNGPWGQGGPSTCRGLALDVSRPIGPGCPFGGLHPGGANTLRADGSVHFESEGIEPSLFRTQLLLKHAEP